MPSNAPAILRCERSSSRKHGVISRDEALAGGISASALTNLVRSGRWIRLQPRAYVPAGTPVTWHTKLAAAQASIGLGFMFSHRTAGALMELDGVPEGAIEIVSHSSPRLNDVIVHRLRPEDCPRPAHFQGFRTTNVERTLLDLFAALGANPAELALEDALRRRLTTLGRLWLMSEEMGRCGRNGSRPFRRCLLLHDHRDGTLQSRMEARLRRIVSSIPGPPAQPQCRVEAGDHNYAIDFAYPHVLLGIEAHSLRWHFGRERWVRDLQRDRRLKRIGWTLLYFPWDDIHLDPKGVAAEILAVRTSLERGKFSKT